MVPGGLAGSRATVDGGRWMVGGGRRTAARLLGARLLGAHEQIQHELVDELPQARFAEGAALKRGQGAVDHGERVVDRLLALRHGLHEEHAAELAARLPRAKREHPTLGDQRPVKRTVGAREVLRDDVEGGVLDRPERGRRPAAHERPS